MPYRARATNLRFRDWYGEPNATGDRLTPCCFRLQTRWRGSFVMRTSSTLKPAKGRVARCSFWIERGDMRGAGARCRSAAIGRNRQPIDSGPCARADERSGRTDRARSKIEARTVGKADGRLISVHELIVLRLRDA